MPLRPSASQIALPPSKPPSLIPTQITIVRCPIPTRSISIPPISTQRSGSWKSCQGLSSHSERLDLFTHLIFSCRLAGTGSIEGFRSIQLFLLGANVWIMVRGLEQFVREIVSCLSSRLDACAYLKDVFSHVQVNQGIYYLLYTSCTSSSSSEYL